MQVCTIYMNVTCLQVMHQTWNEELDLDSFSQESHIDSACTEQMAYLTANHSKVVVSTALIPFMIYHSCQQLLILRLGDGFAYVSGRVVEGA